MDRNHHIGWGLLPLQSLSPIAIRLRNAHIFASLGPKFYIPINLCRIIGIKPFLLDCHKGVLPNFRR